MPGLIGKPIPRFEDLRLLRGKGRYTDDFHLPRELHAVVLRSPHAHAEVKAVGRDSALGMPGVLAVLTAAEWRADGLRPIPHLPNTIDALDVKKPAFRADNASVVFDERPLPLAEGRVRYVGEPVALVVAETLALAKDAAECVAVEYAVLPAVVSVGDALAPEAPLIHAGAPGNLCLAAEWGDAAATARALGEAALVVRHDFVNQRVANAQMEPRAAIGIVDAESGEHKLIAGSQGAHRQKMALIEALQLPADKVQVVCPDVGGGFGGRTMVNVEAVLVLWAARRLGRPVRWTSERGEAFLSDYQGRDAATRAALALDRDGRILALDIELFGNVGAYPVSYVPLANGYRIATTIYRVPAAHMRIRGVLTNTVPTGPYRGAGRPEATFVIERLLDIAARRLRLDRLELRRRNLVRREDLPYRTALGLTFDSGDFLGNMARAAELADWAGFALRRARAATGKLRGIALANYVEAPVGAPQEKVIVTIHANDRIEILTGTQSTGQGHETSFAQVVGEQLGVAAEQIALVSGDTRRLGIGGGTHSDRSMRLAGTLLVEASAKIIAQGRALAAFLLDAPEPDIEFADGLFRVKDSNRSLGLFDVARALEDGRDLPPELQAPLAAEAQFVGRIPAHPTGAAVCEVEIDGETGRAAIVRYTAVDDSGQVINPLILDGQIHGGIAQGAGQALMEQVVWEHATGQVQSGSFMDYAMPRADDFSSFVVESVEDPTQGNPLRVKGGGEAGTTPAAAAIIGAIADALGVEHVEMPATPERLWSLINAKRGAS
jgi:carbon-monoxide dehydrogenase large subunit